MTRDQLNTSIDDNVTNRTEENPSSAPLIGGEMKKLADYVDERIPKVYAALVSQSGASAPTLKELINTTGVTFTASRSGSGNYLLQGSENVFTLDKTALSYFYNSGGAQPNGSMFFYSIGAQFFSIETRISGTQADDAILDAYIKIEIYE